MWIQSCRVVYTLGAKGGFHSHSSCLYELLIWVFLKRTNKHKNSHAVLTLLAGVRFCRHLDVVGGEKAGDPVDLSFPPVRVGLVEDVDQLTLGKAQLVLIGGGIVVHCNNLANWGIGEDTQFSLTLFLLVLQKNGKMLITFLYLKLNLIRGNLIIVFCKGNLTEHATFYGWIWNINVIIIEKKTVYLFVYINECKY